jgi:hypothetical protein
MHACSYVIRWIEMYILWQELKTEMVNSGAGEERPLHDVFRTKTARRQMVRSIANQYMLRGDNAESFWR